VTLEPEPVAHFAGQGGNGMTRFLNQKTIDVGGNLTVMTMPGLDFDTLAAEAGEALKEARTILIDVHTQVKTRPHSDGVRALAEKYFLTHRAAINAEDVDFILKVIRLTINGLVGAQTLKIGDGVSKTRPVHGEVSFKQPEEVMIQKAYHSRTKELDINKKVVYGAIKLERTSLEGKNGVQTLIHEATHKYAGTIDYVYFNEAGEDPSPGLLDKKKALMNADSYAWFAQRVYDRRYPRGVV
jgi:hypothetical protein